jgi:dCMP deaminase
MSYGEQPADVGYANCIAFHAEKNTIVHCPVELRAGTTMYVTHEPCGDCQVLMRAVGIREAVWPAGRWTA